MCWKKARPIGFRRCAKLPVHDGGKVVINDTDHSDFWISLKEEGLAGQRALVWKNFTRGYQVLFMDPYLDPGKDVGRNNPSGRTPDPYWDVFRDAMGQSRRYAMRMDLAATAPHGELASTNYCLANPGKEYLVFLPDGGDVTVDLSAARGEPGRRMAAAGGWEGCSRGHDCRWRGAYATIAVSLGRRGSVLCRKSQPPRNIMKNRFRILGRIVFVLLAACPLVAEETGAGHRPAPRASRQSPLFRRRQRQGRLPDRLAHLGQFSRECLREVPVAAAARLRRLFGVS